MTLKFFHIFRGERIMLITRIRHIKKNPHFLKEGCTFVTWTLHVINQHYLIHCYEMIVSKDPTHFRAINQQMFKPFFFDKRERRVSQTN